MCDPKSNSTQSNITTQPNQIESHTERISTKPNVPIIWQITHSNSVSPVETKFIITASVGMPLTYILDYTNHRCKQLHSVVQPLSRECNLQLVMSCFLVRSPACLLTHTHTLSLFFLVLSFKFAILTAVASTTKSIHIHTLMYIVQGLSFVVMRMWEKKKFSSHLTNAIFNFIHSTFHVVVLFLCLFSISSAHWRLQSGKKYTRGWYLTNFGIGFPFSC